MKRLHHVALKDAALLFLAFALIALNASLNLAQQIPKLTTQVAASRRGVDSVMLTVTVRDRQRNFVKGLTQFNFTVSDGKQEEQIRTFSASDLPLSVGILLDTSLSVGKANLKPIREALGRFFQLSDKTNEYFLVGFNTQPKLLQDWTTDTENILKQIESVRPDGVTAFYDACQLAVEKVARGQHRKHVLILIGDGQDNISNSSYEKLKRSLEESNVLLYSISFFDGKSPGSLGLAGQNILSELSPLTGGVAAFPETTKQLSEVFEMIAVELRNQYLIGFIPTSPDGKRHSLKVKVTLPANAPREMQSLTLRSRKSFYAKMNQP